MEQKFTFLSLSVEYYNAALKKIFWLIYNNYLNIRKFYHGITIFSFLGKLSITDMLPQ